MAMKLLDILGKVGGAILTDLVPGGSIIVSAVNALLPEDKKIPNGATGIDIKSAISSLPSSEQVQLYEKEFDVEITEIQEYTKVIAALADVDKTGNSTRPKIAIMMAYVVCFTVIILISTLGYAIISEKVSTVKAIGESWPLILAILGTPTALLRAYFGMRTKEKQQKYQAVSNHAPISGITSLINMWKSK